MKKNLIILGCGSSVGSPRLDGFWGSCNRKNKKNLRTRCSAIIQKGSNFVLIDTSPDIREQLLKNKIKDISSVVYTHEHSDQTNGLFELRPFFWKYKKRINVYGNTKTIKYLENDYSYLFKKINVYPPIVKSNIVKSTFTLGDKKEKIIFKTFLAKHGKTKSTVYIFEKTAYISDSNDLSIIKNKEMRNLNFIILDCLKYKDHPSHFNLDQALYIHKKLMPKKTILTNLHYDLDYNHLLKKLPKNVIPAFDGMKINL